MGLGEIITINQVVFPIVKMVHETWDGREWNMNTKLYSNGLGERRILVINIINTHRIEKTYALYKP